MEDLLTELSAEDKKEKESYTAYLQYLKWKKKMGDLSRERSLKNAKEKIPKTIDSLVQKGIPPTRKAIAKESGYSYVTVLKWIDKLDLGVEIDILSKIIREIKKTELQFIDEITPNLIANNSRINYRIIEKYWKRVVHLVKETS